MTSTVVVRTDLSGTSFILDVTALELTSSLSTLDFEVTHGGVVVSSLYSKTSQTQLTYAGTNVSLGTKIIARRTTSVIQTETTFISTTTASALTNALEKLRLRTEELDSRLTYTLSQALIGGITIGAIPVNNAAYGAGWSGDTTNAPSKNAVYNGLAPIANPTFTGDPKAPTPATSDNDTSIATTAFVKAQIGTLTGVSAEYNFVLGNGVRFKYGSQLIVVSSSFGSFAYATTPAFSSAPVYLALGNGDSSLTASTVNINNNSTGFFSFNTPTLTAGNIRVNYLAIGT